MHRQAESDEAFRARIATAGAHADVRAEGESCEENGQMEFVVEPVEGGADIVLLAASMIVTAFAESGAAKVETQHGESEALEGFHCVVDDLVVHGSAAERVGMA